MMLKNREKISVANYEFRCLIYYFSLSPPSPQEQKSYEEWSKVSHGVK